MSSRTAWDDTAPIHNPPSPTRRGKPSGHLGTIPLVAVETLTSFKAGDRFQMEGYQTLRGWGKFEVELTGLASQKIGSETVIVQIQDVGGATKRFIDADALKKLPTINRVEMLKVGTTVIFDAYKRTGVIRSINGEDCAVLAETSPGVWLMTHRTVEQVLALNPNVVQAKPAVEVVEAIKYPLMICPPMAIVLYQGQ